MFHVKRGESERLLEAERDPKGRVGPPSWRYDAERGRSALWDRPFEACAPPARQMTDGGHGLAGKTGLSRGRSRTGLAGHGGLAPWVPAPGGGWVSECGPSPRTQWRPASCATSIFRHGGSILIPVFHVKHGGGVGGTWLGRGISTTRTSWRCIAVGVLGNRPVMWCRSGPAVLGLVG